MESHFNKSKVELIQQLITTIQWMTYGSLFFTVFLVVIILYPEILSGLFSSREMKETAVELMATNIPKEEDFWQKPDEAQLEGNPKKESILYGKDIIVNTSHYFGSKGIMKMNATNGMNCQNCHLDGGTKIFGNNYASVSSTYPRYRARSGTEEDIPKRVNDCFERSLNGESLQVNSKEMLAIVDYIHWLGKDVPKGQKAKGSGLKDIAFLDRAADPQKGKLAYAQKCQSCHQPNGSGLMNAENTSYSYPPLWGANSYNDGAGLFRISNFAKYAMYNMPLGVTHESTQISEEEAWDIAAYVNSQDRPKKDISKDWPKIEEKPFDHPFGPFADGFTEEQHKFGPFKPIKEKAEQLKSAQKKL